LLDAVIWMTASSWTAPAEGIARAMSKVMGVSGAIAKR
jgi:hypothetical protein